MARIREFDADEAVLKAMHLFWQNGYAQTGLNLLLEELAISRSSLYKAFGSKSGLFQLVLRQYERVEVAPMLELLSAPELSPSERIYQVFDKVTDKAANGNSAGCLLCNSAAEQVNDPDVVDLIEQMFAKVSRGFRIAVKGHCRKRFLEADGDKMKAVADGLTVYYTGLQVLVRSGMPVKRLKSANKLQVGRLLELKSD